MSLKERLEKKKLSNIEVQDEQVIEKIVDEAIADLEMDTIFEEMEKDKMIETDVTNNVILKEALINRGKTQDIKHDLHLLRSKETEHFIEVMKELHFIKKHMGKFAMITTVLVFLCGYIFGTQHESIFPYISKIFNILDMFKGVQ